MSKLCIRKSKTKVLFYIDGAFDAAIDKYWKAFFSECLDDEAGATCYENFRGDKYYEMFAACHGLAHPYIFVFGILTANFPSWDSNRFCRHDLKEVKLKFQNLDKTMSMYGCKYWEKMDLSLVTDEDLVFALNTTEDLVSRFVFMEQREVLEKEYIKRLKKLSAKDFILTDDFELKVVKHKKLWNYIMK